MNDDFKKYTFSQTINEQARVVFLTYDEIIPSLLLFIIFFTCRHFLIGFLLALIWVIVIKRLKKGKPTSYLLSVAYWFIGVFDFKRIPKSFNVRWLK
jgi:type IV conjugative transfer system protein TraL